MRTISARLLLALAALLSFACAAIHASAYGRASGAIAASTLAPFFGAAFRGLWLIDSAAQLVLGLALALIALKPRSASRLLIAILALIPAATAALLYDYMGNFPPAYVLAAATIMIFAGALLLPSQTERTSP